MAKRISREERIGKRRTLLAISIGVNLGLLGYFKYGGFLLENWTALMGTIGVAWVAPGWDIVLPLLVQGPIVETIFAEAEKLGAELLVIGSHGHSAAHDLLRAASREVSSGSP